MEAPGDKQNFLEVTSGLFTNQELASFAGLLSSQQVVPPEAIDFDTPPDLVTSQYPHITPGTVLYTAAYSIEEAFENRSEYIENYDELSDQENSDIDTRIEALERSRELFGRMYHAINAGIRLKPEGTDRETIVYEMQIECHKSVNCLLRDNQTTPFIAANLHMIIIDIAEIYLEEIDLHF